MRGDLGQLLADLRGEAAVLRSHGQGAQARTLEAACDRVQDCMVDYLAELTEGEAALYTGRTTATVRGWFPALEARGLARLRNHRRLYRRMALDHRGNAEAARAAGQRAVEGAA
jgi:hypothetical protein